MIPEAYHPETTRTERYIYNKIANEPNSDMWVCFHSLGLSAVRGKRSGEIDFLLCIPNMGILILEVKGGKISVSPNGVWNYDGYSKAESPFQQARASMYSVISEVKSKFGDKSRMAQLLFGYCILIPDMVNPPIPGCEGNEKLVFSANDVPHSFRRYIERVRKYATDVMYYDRSFAYPNERDISKLVHWITGNAECGMTSPNITAMINAINNEQHVLTQQQYKCLRLAHEYPRIIVDGCAGTGKTELAKRIALREAQHGKVLFLCYNKSLARNLSRQIESSEVHVETVHGYFRRMVERSIYEKEFKEKSKFLANDVFFGDLLPEYAQLAVSENTKEHFNYIVIDEGQDIITHSVFKTLDTVLRKGIRSGRWCIFLDSNLQADVYGVLNRKLLKYLTEIHDTRRQQLYMNCRNTRQIVQWIRTLTDPYIDSISVVDGFRVTLEYFSDDIDQLEKLAMVIHSFRDEGIPSSRIAILSPYATDSIMEKYKMHSDDYLSKSDTFAILENAYMRNITVSTVSSFKGLESDVVLLTDIKKIRGKWWQSVIYTGMSRARVRLYLLFHDSVSGIVEQSIHNYIKRGEVNDG